MKKKLLLVVSMLAILMCLLAISVSAAEYTDANGIKYTTNSDGTAQVADNTDFTGTEAIIAEKITVDGVEYTVTSVAGNAFDYLTTLTTIYFPPTITTITGWTFSGASSIEKIYIDFENLTYVGSLGFTTGTNGGGYNNVKEDIVIYATSEYGKETPTQTTVANFANLTNIGQASFQGLNVSKIIIGENVTSFGIQSFRGSAVQELILNCTNITTVPSYSFDGCASLTTIDASNVSLVNIGSNAFSATKSLTSLTLDFSGIKRIEGSAFSEAGANTTVNFASDINLSSLEYLGGSAFKKSKLTGAIVFSANCDIDSASYAFENVPITSVVINNVNTTKIPAGFMSGASLKSIVIKSTSLVTVEGSAFSTCKSVEKIYIDMSKVTSVGANAFCFAQQYDSGNTKTQWYNLDGETVIDLSSLETIGGSGNSGAFASSNIGSAKITWPKAIKSMADQAFRRANLTEVYLNAAEGSSITAMYWAFNGNPIKLLVVGQGVTLSNQLEAQCTVVLLSETTITNADFIKVSGSKIYYTSLAGSNTTFANAEMIQITGGTATSTACGIDCSVILASDNSNVVISVPVHTWDEGVVNEAYCPIGAVIDFGCTYCDAEKTEGEGTEHSHTVAVIVYESGFFNVGLKTLKCANDECTSVLSEGTEVKPIFTALGYSKSEVGAKSVMQGFAIDQDVLQEYNASTDDKIVGYGVMAASKIALNDEVEVFENGALKNVKVAQVDFSNRSYDVMEIKISGLEGRDDVNGDYVALELYCCGYYLVKNGEAIDSYYASEDTVTDTLVETITYNNITTIK